MPSVDLTRLNAQIEALFTASVKPEIFIRNLNALLQLYSHQAYSAGTGVIATASMNAYRVPDAVMVALEKRMKSWVEDNPKATLSIADSLWRLPQVENKHLTLLILASQPVKSTQKILWRIHRWIMEENESSIQRELIMTGCSGLITQQPQTFLNQVRHWLAHKDASVYKAGLIGLLMLSQREGLRDEPLVLDILQDLLEKFSLEHQSVIFEILENLIPRHPAECASVITNALLKNPGYTARKLARRSLDLFPEPYAEMVHLALKR